MLQISAGHLSSAELSAVVLGSSFCNVFGMSPMAGLASTLDTLCGHVSSCPSDFPYTMLRAHASLHNAQCTFSAVVGSIAVADDASLRQANGAKQYLTVGTVYQRALLIMTLFCTVVLLPLWLNVGWIFVAFGALRVTVFRCIIIQSLGGSIAAC